MNLYTNTLPRLYSNVIRILFLKLKRFESYLLSKQKIKILFSNKEEWKSDIMAGFEFTNHDIVFNDFPSCNLKEYDLIVPLTIPDLMYLNEMHEDIVDNTIPIPSKNIIKLCDDKYLFNQELIKNGFEEFVPTIDNNLRYPFILKKKIDQWGENCHIIFDAQQELNFTDIINSPSYFTQEIIPGKHEYATHILFKGQKIVRSLNIMYSFNKEIPIKGKDREYYTTICHCPYLDIFSDILKSLSFEGLCCINYKVSDNQPQILEINPRCGGSLCPYLFSFIESEI